MAPAWRGPHISWLFCPIYQEKALARALGMATVRDIVEMAARNAGFDDFVVKDFSGRNARKLVMP